MSNTLVTKENQAANGTTVERTHNGASFSPRFDILETKDELKMYGDLPGVSPETLDIQFENSVLTIHGHVEPRHDDIKFLYGEYGIGDFHRTFTVGETIDSEKISAEMRDGVLTIHLPKIEAVKPKKIKVNVA